MPEHRGDAELRRFFVLAPTVRDRTLSLLAGDARNAPIVLALMPNPRSISKESDWPRRLIQSMVLANDYAGAEAMWTRLSGVSERGLLYNPQFRDLPAPPPFNWNYGSGSSGVAEPSGRGGLDVIYYGREDATLANRCCVCAGRKAGDADRRPSRESGIAWDRSFVTPVRHRSSNCHLERQGRGPFRGPSPCRQAGAPHSRSSCAGVRRNRLRRRNCRSPTSGSIPWRPDHEPGTPDDRAGLPIRLYRYGGKRAGRFHQSRAAWWDRDSSLGIPEKDTPRFEAAQN